MQLYVKIDSSILEDLSGLLDNYGFKMEAEGTVTQLDASGSHYEAIVWSLVTRKGVLATGCDFRSARSDGDLEA